MSYPHGGYKQVGFPCRGVRDVAEIGPLTATKHVFDARGCLLTNYGFKERLVKLAVEKDMLDKDAEWLGNKEKWYRTLFKGMFFKPVMSLYNSAPML